MNFTVIVPFVTWKTINVTVRVVYPCIMLVILEIFCRIMALSLVIVPFDMNVVITFDPYIFRVFD